MKKIFTRLFLICFFTLAVNNISFAKEWVVINTSKTIVSSFDKDSVREISKNKYTIIEKFDYVESVGKQMSLDYGYARPIAYALSKIEFNVKGDYYVFRSIDLYDNNGEYFETVTSPVPLEEMLIPNTLPYKFFQASYPIYKKKYNR